MRITTPPSRKANFFEIFFAVIVFTAFALLFFNLGRAYEIVGTHTKEPPSVAFQPQKTGSAARSKPSTYPTKWTDVIPPISFNSFKMPTVTKKQ